MDGAIRRNQAVDASRAKTALLLPGIVRCEARTSVADPVTAGVSVPDRTSIQVVNRQQGVRAAKSPPIGRETADGARTDWYLSTHGGTILVWRLTSRIRRPNAWPVRLPP
jgi:hypothetical protein